VGLLQNIQELREKFSDVRKAAACEHFISGQPRRPTEKETKSHEPQLPTFFSLERSTVLHECHIEAILDIGPGTSDRER
jgi:hypothetical protein